MATPDGLPKPGTELAQKYVIQRVIGQGGMGIVYEAVHRGLQQRVAIKMLLPHMAEQPEQVARFAREAHAAGKLRSKHAARILDVDTSASGLPYLVMEYLEGHDLGKELDLGGALRVRVAVDYVLQACVALNEAHAVGIVHRDLKPPNLFLAKEGEGYVVKLLDFGISKVAQEAGKLTEADSMIGTALYMSPEQVRAADKVDSRSDVWSLGVILYELLSGKTPWTGTTTQVAAAIVTEAVPTLPSTLMLPLGLETVVRTALSRSLVERYQSVLELAEALLPYADEGALGVVGSRAILSGPASNPRSSPRMSAAQQALARRDSLTVSTRAPVTPTDAGWTEIASTRTQKRLAFGVAAGVLSVLFVVVLGLVMSKRADHAANASAPAREAPVVASAAVPATGVPSPLESSLAVPAATTATPVVGGEPRALRGGRAPAQAGSATHGTTVAPPAVVPSAAPTPTVTTSSNPLHL